MPAVILYTLAGATLAALYLVAGIGIVLWLDRQDAWALDRIGVRRPWSCLLAWLLWPLTVLAWCAARPPRRRREWL